MVLTGILLVTTQDTFAKNPTYEGKAKKKERKKKRTLHSFWSFQIMWWLFQEGCRKENTKVHFHITGIFCVVLLDVKTAPVWFWRVFLVYLVFCLLWFFCTCIWPNLHYFNANCRAAFSQNILQAHWQRSSILIFVSFIRLQEGLQALQ